MPKKLTREERLAKHRAWANSPHSLNGRLAKFDREKAELEKKLLTECIERGLSVKATARKLHTTPLRIRQAARRHNLRFSTQLSEAEMKIQSERQSKKRKEVASKDPLAQLAERLEAEGRFDHPAPQVLKSSKPERIETPVVPPEAVEPSAGARQKFYRQVLTGAKYPKCGHTVEMNNVAWLTPEVFTCAKCATRAKKPIPHPASNPSSNPSSHRDSLADLAAQHGF